MSLSIYCEKIRINHATLVIFIYIPAGHTLSNNHHIRTRKARLKNFYFYSCSHAFSVENLSSNACICDKMARKWKLGIFCILTTVTKNFHKKINLYDNLFYFFIIFTHVLKLCNAFE